MQHYCCIFAAYCSIINRMVSTCKNDVKIMAWSENWGMNIFCGHISIFGMPREPTVCLLHAAAYLLDTCCILLQTSAYSSLWLLRHFTKKLSCAKWSRDPLIIWGYDRGRSLPNFKLLADLDPFHMDTFLLRRKRTWCYIGNGSF